MGLLDKIKEMLGGHKEEVKTGVDKTSDTVEKRVGEEHAPKVENAAETAKDAVDKLPE